jgi:hypothetical protein
MTLHKHPHAAPPQALPGEHLPAFVISTENLSAEQRTVLKSLLHNITGETRDVWRLQSGSIGADVVLVGTDRASGRSLLRQLRAQEYPVPLALGRDNEELPRHVLLLRQPFQSSQVVQTLDTIGQQVTSARATGLAQHTEMLANTPKERATIQLAFTLRGMHQAGARADSLKVTLGELGVVYVIPARRAIRTALDVTAIGMLAARVPVRTEPIAHDDAEFENMAALEQPWDGMIWSVGMQQTGGKLFPWVDANALNSVRALPPLGGYRLSDAELKMLAALTQAAMNVDHLARVAKVPAAQAVAFVNALSLTGALRQTSAQDALSSSPDALVASTLRGQPKGA